jgi:molecular chaperone Hsp33
MSDILVRGNSMDGAIRVFCAVTTDLVNEAHKIHNTGPVASAALGRLLSGAVLMGASTLKSESDSLTLQINGDGPLGRIIAVTDSSLKVRGYVTNPYVDLPLNQKGKIDVSRGVGRGDLSVIRDLGLKEPYIGRIPLISGEIAEDLTYYFAKSEQIPTAIALGVLVDTDMSIKAAGGFMIQLMPEATDDMAKKLENIIGSLPSVTEMISGGMSAMDMAFRITDGFSMVMENKTVTPEYKCKCSRERMERALISIGKEEIQSIIDEQGHAEMCCQFCNKKYDFNKEQLEELLKSAK